MPRRSAPKQYAQRSVIYLTFFLLLSIPVVLYGLAQENLDTRRRAFEDLELSEEHPCLISLPNVNPYSLQVGRTVTIQVDALLKDDYIDELEISDSSGDIIYQETFEGAPLEIATSFPFTPKESGEVDMLGIIKKGQGGRVECEISSPYDIKGLRAITNNSSPEFTSNPSQSEPSQNIVTGDQYEYTVTATDADGDRINYSYSFTPRADWLKPVIIEDGSNGKLTIKFRGSSNKAASYLANIFIHDGYSKHLRSQSWVISVSPKENDIPIVRIIDPIQSIRIDRGTSFKTSWEATDLNHIIRYELYITNNPANEESWKAIDTDIDYNTTSYTVETQDITPGTYKIITKAIDNQNPAGVGMGVSSEIVISGSTEQEEKDDVVTLEQPQVVNMSPISTEEITNKRVTVRATIIASKDSTVDENSIKFTLDGNDITDSIKINRITSSELTLIYQPEEDLEEGVHKAEVRFLDSKGLSVSKSWNFTIQGDSSTKEDTYTIFGYEIAQNIVLIVGIGVITVILALVAPFVIFTIWKEDKGESDFYGQPNSKLPPSTPVDNTPYILSDENNRIKEKVDTKPTSEKKEEDVWDMYSAAKPVVTEEQKSKDLEDLQQKDSMEPSPTPQNQPALEPTVKAEQEIPVSEPVIPEPEIPDAQDLEKIFQQIQQAKQEEKQQPPVVNE
jgi:hypothetical protein